MLFISIIIVGYIITFLWSKTSKYKDKIKQEHCIKYNTRELINRLDNAIFNSTLETLPKFSFQQFLHFYNLNPTMWLLTDDRDKIVNVPCRIEWRPSIQVKQFDRVFDYYPIFFTNWIEFEKYKRWVKRHFKEEKERQIQEERNQATKEFCEIVQKDIDKAYADLNASIKEYHHSVSTAIK